MLETLTDDELDRLHILLCTMSFGQEGISIDTHAGSLFNKVAVDLEVNMLDYWKPDEDFLNRRNTEQLQGIIQDTETGRIFGFFKQAKKSELVRKMATFFDNLFNSEKPDEQDMVAANWLPEAMHFPAIDPDNVQSDNDSQAENEDVSIAA